MKVIVIEDEKPSARRLSRMLLELNIEVQAMLHSVEEAVTYFEENEHPDLILLDIQLSDGLSFEIFEQVDVNCAIIFATAYDEYALKAFKLNSIDYLLKPIDEDELKTAIDKFKTNRQEPQNIKVNLEQIKKLLVNSFDKSYKERFTVKVGQHLKIIPIDEIECFYSENKATYIHTSTNRDYLIDYSLEQLETILDPRIFFRVSRKFYVNMNAIKDIISYTNSRLKVILKTYSEQEVIVSREKVKDFKCWIS